MFSRRRRRVNPAVMPRVPARGALSGTGPKITMSLLIDPKKPSASREANASSMDE
jgi:hypothetical protein